MNFYERLKQECNKKGVSPTGLLKLLKISTSKLTSWKNGSMPNSEFLIPISEFLEVSIDYLLTGKVQNSHSDISLSKEEQDCLNVFNNLEPEDQMLALGFMKGLSAKYTPESKENVS